MAKPERLNGDNARAEPSHSQHWLSRRSGVQRVYGWACERLYHEWAWGYDRVAWGVSLGRWAAWRRLALDQLRPEESQILEIGFGTGALLAEIAQSGRRVIGLEPSWQMQRVAGQRRRHQGLRPPRVAALAQAMPFSGRAFDAVIATFPAPYILDPATLHECARVVRSGGRLIVAGLWVTPAVRWLAQASPVFFGRPGAHVFATVEQRLAQAGFSCHILEQRCGWANVGLIVGERWRPGV